MMTKTGTPQFKAPEMIESFMYDEKVDMWMVGCVLYTMLFGYSPFGDIENEARLYQSILKADYSIPEETKVDADICEFVLKLMEVDPEKRLSATQALSHEWFKECSRPSTFFINPHQTASSDHLVDDPRIAADPSAICVSRFSGMVEFTPDKESSPIGI